MFVIENITLHWCVSLYLGCCSPSLCFITADHHALEELYEKWLSGVSAAEKCFGSSGIWHFNRTASERCHRGADEQHGAYADATVCRLGPCLQGTWSGTSKPAAAADPSGTPVADGTCLGQLRGDWFHCFVLLWCYAAMVWHIWKCHGWHLQSGKVARICDFASSSQDRVDTDGWRRNWRYGSRSSQRGSKPSS